jgi:geranylgeranyl pyrophosphate synthase
MLTQALTRALTSSCHNPELREVMDYAVMPAGKLVRPRLVEALALDLVGGLAPDHLHLASAIELHHAYTLVHDDLPSMDNDLVRRGKPATHVRYGEWKAILGGDALLIASFNELANVRHRNFRPLNRLLAWATGAKGLVEGQFRDLASDGKVPFPEVVRIHELKTGRLIQVATLGTYLLTEAPSLRGCADYLRLGREIGVTFQLLDDLSELAEETVSEHERNINPFMNTFADAFRELSHSRSRLATLLARHRLAHLERMMAGYFLANQTKLQKDFSWVQKNVGADLPQLREWLTSFA